MESARSQERKAIVEAFLSVREGWSADRVVVDPNLNSRFESECRRMGLTLGIGACNRVLLNLRKAGKLRGLKSRRTSFVDQDEYEFASEIAIRFLERRDEVTLDDVICDPIRVSEFDTLAQQLSPGFFPLQYRWAALSLRKNSGLRPEPLGHVVCIESVHRMNVCDLVLADLPDAQAVYLFYCSTKLLYVGETVDIRARFRKHLEHSDNRGLARWLWAEQDEPLFVEYHILPRETSTRVRKAVELELIRSRTPEFNVKR